uniref:Myosin motor domain-containing protein n=1 Tax=Caenorhabditis japonica TaxID=281687 RepID=A0A8R1DKC1_CAEJA
MHTGKAVSQRRTKPRDLAMNLPNLEPPKNSQKHRKKMEINTDSKNSDFGQIVWISDPADGFVAARVTDISQDGFTLATLANNETVQRRYDETFATEEDLAKSAEDNCALMHLNEATLLNNCRVRYANGKIYSYVANILISINPYQPIDGFYSSETIKSYRGKSLGQMEPHIFAISDKAYREMRRNKMSQSIIVSGESGAGKTESQKAVLRYLCENWGAEAGPIQQRLLETNPILEAFGNAKTLRNNNSSRFGKFVQIHFAENGTVAGGFISHYLLETSRVCRQAANERNYHIFYQLIAGMPADLYQKLALGLPETFNYLKHGSTAFFVHPKSSPRPNAERTSKSVFSTDTMVDDYQDFARLQKALTLSGISNDEQMFIWGTIAGILHLGNIEFEENVGDSRGGCRVTPNTERSLAHAARLLGLEEEEMKLGLCARIMQATKGGVKGTLIRVPLKAHEAAAGRDALAKTIYSKLFDWLVAAINKSIPFETSSGYIGVLDVAGFEFFAVNSFEQFCINFCNEKLQNFFNERILKQEQELYAEEGLHVPKIEFSDNHDCIQLFEAKATGLFDLLDEEIKLPRATFQHFTQRAHEANQKHFRLDTPRKSKIKAHREMRDDEGLLIRHYAGSVCYETRYFVEKNNDQLHNSLEILIEQSSFPLLVALFNSNTDPAPISSKTGGKLKSLTVGAKFKSQLAALLEKLNDTGTHFVRCIKPNNQMKAWTFDGAAILSQLQCAGITSVLRLMQQGFPSRTSFASLYSTYESRLPPNLARLDARLFSKCLFHALGLEQRDFQFGLTKVFFRAGKFVEFDMMMRQDAETMTQLIAKANGWLIKARWRKAQYGAWSVIKLRNKIAYRFEAAKKIQAWTRGCLVRKRFAKRLTVYRKSLALWEQAKEINEILNNLNDASKATWGSSVNSTTCDLESLVQTIKKVSLPQEIAEVGKAYEKLAKQVDAMISALKQQAKNDEMAEVVRRRKEAEDKERREAEERAAAEKEREMRRKAEVERERAQKEYEAQLVAQLEKEAAERAAEKKVAAKKEQDRLDAMVSSRLATSDGVALAPEPAQAQTSTATSSSHGKYDLSNWKYADLRDAINTSQDLNLLVACKEEFHRRLRIYNDWKSKNSAKRDEPPTRAPLAVYNQPSTSTEVALVSPKANRYFKVSFVSGGTDKRTGTAQSGMWYAHFAGRYCERQISLRPFLMPQLLVAGKDDLNMCELPLEQTGLLRKKGAEISEQEFESQWLHYGGKTNF